MNCGNLAVNLKSISGSKVVPHKDGYIYWHIREDKLTSDIDKYKIILAFENGFKELEKVFYPIQFKSTSVKEEAPILLGFYKQGDKDLPIKFDKDVLAYAFANYEGFSNSSDIFFNDAYKWAELDKPNAEINLKKVFVHECLHALGFDHSNDQKDILFWQYQIGDDITFSQDTVSSIKARYKEEMDKIKKVEPAQISIIEFCRSVINFQANSFYIPSQIFKSVCNYFNLDTKGMTNSKIKITLLNFLKNG